MNIDPSLSAAKRAYRQDARARAAEQTGERILDVFQRRIREDWFDEITLDQVAKEAGVTVPTIVRRFSGKDGLLEAVWERLAVELQARRRILVAQSLPDAIAGVIADYETVGDIVLRALAQEERLPGFRRITDVGRAHHRAWVEAAFARHLAGLPDEARRARVNGLVVATDIYVWKLLRHDMGESPGAVQALMLKLIAGVLGAPGPSPKTLPAGETPHE